MLALRNYQQDQVNEVSQALRAYWNVLLQCPTGGGKTVIASYILHRVANAQRRGYFICHRRELIDQTSLTFKKFGIKHSFIASGYHYNPYHHIQICSIDTLKNRLDMPLNPDFCVWDEAHHIRAAGWVRVHEHFSKSRHIGLSATPQRLDGRGLDDRFDCLVAGPSVSWLIDNGYLAKYKLFSVPGCDRSNLHMRMGNFITAEAEHAMDKPTITGNILSHWKSTAAGKLTIGFSISRKMSEKYAQEFRSAGIPSIHLDGETPKVERKKALQAYARGDIKVIWNVGLFGEGFDISANSGMDVTVGCMIDAAPTASLSAWLQRCGRALRPQKDHAIILDHSGNIKHGLPCEDREWTLEGREVSKGGEQGETETIKQCPECFAVHKPAPVCTECGHVYEVQSRVIAEVEGELEQIDIESIRAERAKERAQAKTHKDLQELEKRRGYKTGYADHVARAREEKKALRDRLIFLNRMHSTGMSISDVYELKPKALKEAITLLERAENERVNAECN